MLIKIGDTVSAGLTAVAAGGIIINPQAVAPSLPSHLQWAVLAGISSLILFLAVVFGSTWWRSVGRVLSGCLWGTVLLVALWKQCFPVLLIAAVVLFVFDFFVVWRERSWLKSKYPNCSVAK
jgi:uncharacterized membrane protein